MSRTRTWSGIGVVVLGGAMALAPATVVSASQHKPPHHTTKKKHSTSNVGSLHCPKKSLISSATGVTFTGPSANNGGTAACIYTDAAKNDLNVVFDDPNQSRSHFVATDPGAIGKPAQAMTGIGSAAFSTTTYGHAEIDVYESSTKGFAVTLDPANGAAVTPIDLTEVVSVAHAIATSKG